MGNRFLLVGGPFNGLECPIEIDDAEGNIFRVMRPTQWLEELPRIRDIGPYPSMADRYVREEYQITTVSVEKGQVTISCRALVWKQLRGNFEHAAMRHCLGMVIADLLK